jgi:hypothetical protein
MMGERRSGQDALFYEFSLERHVPADCWPFCRLSTAWLSETKKSNVYRRQDMPHGDVVGLSQPRPSGMVATAVARGSPVQSAP